MAFFADRGVTAADLLKCLAVVDDDGEPVVLVVPGDREARIPQGWRLFEDVDFAAHPALVKGYIGPAGQQAHGIRVVADYGVRAPGPWTTGANRADHHVTGARLGRDFTVDAWGSYAEVATGDPCPRCGDRARPASGPWRPGTPSSWATKYSDVMEGATFVAEDGVEARYSMGCYGMGVSRLVAVLAEEYHDDKGLDWPAAVAPYGVHLLSLGAGRSPEVAAAADGLYGALVAAGVDVLYDDRDVSPG